MKWQERPVIVSFNDKTTSIETIPFPAITVCTTQMGYLDKVNVTRLINDLDKVYWENKEKSLNLTSKE